MFSFFSLFHMGLYSVLFSQQANTQCKSVNIETSTCSWTIQKGWNCPFLTLEMTPNTINIRGGETCHLIWLRYNDTLDVHFVSPASVPRPHRRTSRGSVTPFYNKDVYLRLISPWWYSILGSLETGDAKGALACPRVRADSGGIWWGFSHSAYVWVYVGVSS